MMLLQPALRAFALIHGSSGESLESCVIGHVGRVMNRRADSYTKETESWFGRMGERQLHSENEPRSPLSGGQPLIDRDCPRTQVELGSCGASPAPVPIRSDN